MVFDPQAVPHDREGFMAWYFEQTKWSEAHGYDNPKVTKPELNSWFLDMSLEFPSIDDPKHRDDIDNTKLSGYNFGSVIIYVTFAWSEAENAYEAMFRLAKKHKIGFFDVSKSNGQVWLPDTNGNYHCIHGECSE